MLRILTADRAETLRRIKTGAIGAGAGLLFCLITGGLLAAVIIATTATEGPEATLVAGTALGYTVFLLFPAFSGFVATIHGRPGDAAWPSLLLMIIGACTCLLVTQFEGLLCILLSLPLVIPGVLIGGWLGRVHRRNNAGGRKLRSVVIAAAVLPLAQLTEGYAGPWVRTNEVISEAQLDAPPRRVWDTVKALDSLSVKRSLWFELGLPAPLDCTLRGDRVGAQRTCRFDDGFIEQRVEIWEPPHRMVLRITEVELGGRFWLGFDEAEYRLRATSAGTRIVRRTVARSILRPAVYWAYVERLAIDAEHRYLFAELRRRLAGD